MKPISQNQFASLRNRLEQRRNQLRIELRDEKTLPVRSESDSQDIEQSYASDQDQQVEEELDEQHTLELQDIDAALQRMDAGHYGSCQDCGDSIGVDRLTAYPMAKRCLVCKQALEQESRITRHTLAGQLCRRVIKS